MGTTSNECSTSWHQGVQSNTTTCIVNKNNVLSSHRSCAFKSFRLLYGLETRPFSNLVFFILLCVLKHQVNFLTIHLPTFWHAFSWCCVKTQPRLVIFRFCLVFRSPYNSTSR